MLAVEGDSKLEIRALALSTKGSAGTTVGTPIALADVIEEPVAPPDLLAPSVGKTFGLAANTLRRRDLRSNTHFRAK